jgi:hypothetical protein
MIAIEVGDTVGHLDAYPLEYGVSFGTAADVGCIIGEHVKLIIVVAKFGLAGVQNNNLRGMVSKHMGQGHILEIDTARSGEACIVHAHTRGVADDGRDVVTLAPGGAKKEYVRIYATDYLADFMGDMFAGVPCDPIHGEPTDAIYGEPDTSDEQEGKEKLLHDGLR